MLPYKFQLNWSFGLGKEGKNRFSSWPPWRPFWIFNRNILATFDLQVTTLLPTKFRVNWSFGSEEAKNRFSRWPPWPPYWISDWNDFSYFWCTRPQCFLPSFENWPFGSGEEGKIDFQDGRYRGRLRLPIRTISATFARQITTMLPTKFRVDWPFGSGEEAKNRFSRWPPRQPSWISDRNNFSYFLIYKSPQCFVQSL